MCFSASASYSAAVVLLATGGYALYQAGKRNSAYWLFAVAPLMFGIQQALEGRVWQLMESGDAADAVNYALGFHFFSHFYWLWWIPLCSYHVEREMLRRRLFLGIALFGALAGGVVYFTLLFNRAWLIVSVEQHHIVYDISSPLRGPFSIGMPPSVLYGVIILVPLLFSSYRQIRHFGWMVLASIVVASLAYGYAFVSVWCFFAALLSLYLAYIADRYGMRQGDERGQV